MTTIFDSARPVKTTRKPFARGLKAAPVRQPYTAADLAWAAANLNASSRDYVVTGPADSLLEQMAGASSSLDRLEAGIPCF